MNSYFISRKPLVVIASLCAAFLGHGTSSLAQAAPAMHHPILEIEVELVEGKPKASSGSTSYYAQLIEPLFIFFGGNAIHYSEECKAARATITEQELALIQSFLSKKEKRDLYKRLVRVLSVYLLSEESSSEQKLAVRPFVEKFLAYYAACEKLKGDSLKAYEILQKSFEAYSVDS